VVNQEVLQWIDRDGTRPFLTFLNYFDVHYPYGSPPTYPKPAWDNGGRIDEYDASVKYTDDATGRLMQALDRRGLAHNTLVIITSDHGESLGQHGLTYHAQALYRELIHVPLVIWYPGHVPEGMRVPTPVSNAAIPATIMDMIAASAPDTFPSSSLSPLWRTGGGANWSDPLSELAQNDIIDKEDKIAGKTVPIASTGSMKSVVTPQWHFITHETRGNQLYDWMRDPGEASDLTSTPDGKAAALSLRSEMEVITEALVKKK
jgi:arylsulfatase A-like enzyme